MLQGARQAHGAICVWVCSGRVDTYPRVLKSTMDRPKDTAKLPFSGQIVVSARYIPKYISTTSTDCILTNRRDHIMKSRTLADTIWSRPQQCLPTY